MNAAWLWTTRVYFFSCILLCALFLSTTLRAEDGKLPQEENPAAAETAQESADARIEVKTADIPACNSFTFDATQSYDPDKQNLTYFWEFGDGANSSEPVVTHTYNKSGKYTVKLAVTDTSPGHCNTAASAQIINVNLSPKAAFNAPAKICVDQEISLAAEEVHSDKPGHMTYWWDFGDGTRQEGQTVAKAFQAGGDYTVTLIVDDNAKTGCSTDRAQQRIRVNAPPQAQAGADIAVSCQEDQKNHPIQFDAAASQDLNGDELTYAWDFGDGQSAEGKIVSHEYAQSGMFKAKLTVTDNSGLTCNRSTDTVTVHLRKAPVAKAGEDKSACTGENLTFNGTASAESDADILFSNWDFGDGSAERGLKVNHTYARPGKYTATLTVELADTEKCPVSSDPIEVVINSAPQLSLQAPKIVCLGEKAAFEAIAKDPNGNKLEYFWSFGDGNIVKGGPKVTHTFEKGGNYPVNVIVDDGKKSDCSSVSASTPVKVNTPPTANAGENTACCLGEPTVFNALLSNDVDGDALSYHWDFGDGTTSTDAMAQHTYEKSGTYPVKLTVDDNTPTGCRTSTAEFTAMINETPVPIIKIK